MSCKKVNHFGRCLHLNPEMMNTFKGHFEFIENIFRLNLFELHLMLGFEHPHFMFQKSLNMMQQDAHTRQYQKQGMWQTYTVTY